MSAERKRSRSRSKSRTPRNTSVKRSTPRSASQSKKSVRPSAKFDLIVFDIDSTLFDSIEKEKEKDVSTKADHKLIHGGINYKLYSRPHLEKFMHFCQRNFKKIALWTHADQLWLKKFVDNILPNDIELLFKYDRSHGEDKVIGNKGEIKIKPLKKIYAEFPEYNASNTIIIEDTEDNCLDNLKNCIIVPEFSVLKHDKGDSDIVLPLLAKYLLKLQTGKISTIDRKGWYKKELAEIKKKSRSKSPVKKKN